MSDAPDTTVSAHLPPGVAANLPPLGPPAATEQHVNALRRELQDFAAFVGQKFEQLLAELRKAVPVVEDVAAGVAEVVPAVAPVAAAVDKFFYKVGGFLMCVKHNAIGCASCKEAADGQAA